MHQDIVPLCAADIQEQLKKRFAYLSGEFRKPGPGCPGLEKGQSPGLLPTLDPPVLRCCL